MNWQRKSSPKKSQSAVEGDILPSLANTFFNITAIPATRIMSFCLSMKTWPSLWNLETQTVIPKEEGASKLDQLRNLSCTNALSKILESCVLKKLQEEVTIKPNQYGGLRGSGTCHFLIKCWDFILRSLDEPNAAVSLLAVDFSKAFNRMSHHACVDALIRAGASTDSLAMTIAFLSDRKMRVKVGNSYSRTLPVRGGSPRAPSWGVSFSR